MKKDRRQIGSRRPRSLPAPTGNKTVPQGHSFRACWSRSKPGWRY